MQADLRQLLAGRGGRIALGDTRTKASCVPQLDAGPGHCGRQARQQFARSGHHRLRHASGALVFTGSTPSCARAVKNAAAVLRRAERQHQSTTAGSAPAQQEQQQ